MIAVLIALAPYGFYVYVQKRRRIRYEQEFARFLFELSELLRGGLDPVAGVIELAASATPDVYRGMESLAPHIDLLAKQLNWGMTFEEGMFDLSKQLKSKFIEKYTYLVVQASRIGGGIGDVIMQCSADMEKTFALEREKDAELKEFILIIYNRAVHTCGNAFDASANANSCTSGYDRGIGSRSSNKFGVFNLACKYRLPNGILPCNDDKRVCERNYWRHNVRGRCASGDKT